jgi:hypothetical protein
MIVPATCLKILSASAEVRVAAVAVIVMDNRMDNARITDKMRFFMMFFLFNFP